jgi:hypothetical protein
MGNSGPSPGQKKLERALFAAPGGPSWNTGNPLHRSRFTLRAHNEWPGKIDRLG